MIQAGELAPDFELKGHDDQLHKLSSYRGKRVLLVFYPLDFSPVCSNELVCFRDDFSGFNNAGVQVLGISVDSVWAHKAFAQKQGIEFPLLADFQPRGAAAAKFGLFYEDKGITHRAIVLIGADGKVEKLWHYEIGQAPDIKAVLGSL